MLLFRIMKTSAVRGDFNVRKASYRKYFYRFAVRKKKVSVPFPSDYIHDWSNDLELEDNAGELMYKQNKLLTGVGRMLPLTDQNSIAEIRYTESI